MEPGHAWAEPGAQRWHNSSSHPAQVSAHRPNTFLTAHKAPRAPSSPPHHSN